MTPIRKAGLVIIAIGAAAYVYFCMHGDATNALLTILPLILIAMVTKE